MLNFRPKAHPGELNATHRIGERTRQTQRKWAFRSILALTLAALLAWGIYRATRPNTSEALHVAEAPAIPRLLPPTPPLEPGDENLTLRERVRRQELRDIARKIPFAPFTLEFEWGGGSFTVTSNHSVFIDKGNVRLVDQRDHKEARIPLAWVSRIRPVEQTQTETPAPSSPATTSEAIEQLRRRIEALEKRLESPTPGPGLNASPRPPIH